MDNLIEMIENLCGEADANAASVIEKIKQAIAESRKPDFSKIKDGEHFFYRGMEWIRLGLEQGGVLCMTAQVWRETMFDEENFNNWKESSGRKLLNTEFLSLLDKDDLLPFESDLIADNGDKSYGKCTDLVGILSCDLYRKYREFVPLFSEWMWTCTPWKCGTPYSGYAGDVRIVDTSGALSGDGASGSYGFAPACIFNL